MFQDIEVTEAMSKQQSGEELLFIDVRSPSEYEDATIPGAINIPLFNDEERAEIGTLYKQNSVSAAEQRGLEIVSAKLPAFIRSFQALEAKNKIVFCWRGGMRSKTTATLLSLMNTHVSRLSGGVRAYRKWVVDTLEDFRIDAKAIVLHGNTGSGKTRILRDLQEQGYPVLDLEGLAGHRGSIFGHIGLPSYNQKKFDSLLVHRLIELQHSPYFLMEAESKRIGKAILPEFIMNAKQEGVAFSIELPLKERVLQIVEDYEPQLYKQECLEAFARIKKRIHTPIAQEIEWLLQSQLFEKAVELLLVYYYDPLYAHSALQYESYFSCVKADTIEEAVSQLQVQLESLQY